MHDAQNQCDALHRAPPETAAACWRLGLFFGFFSPGFAPSVSVVRFFLSGLLFLFDQRFLFFFEVGAIGDIALAIEVDAAIDQRLLDDGVGAERIVIVDDQVGVFADVDRADALVDAELDRGIDGDQLERFVVREAAELHGLRGFLIEVRGFFGVVGIDGNDHAAARHERGVVGDRVVGFYFVGPPIGERGSADACGGDFVGDFVAFEDVLERAHLEAEFLRHAKQHQDFVFAVAMRVNVALAFENFDERIETQIAARRDQRFSRRRRRACCSRPRFAL